MALIQTLAECKAKCKQFGCSVNSNDWNELVVRKMGSQRECDTMLIDKGHTKEDLQSAYEEAIGSARIIWKATAFAQHIVQGAPADMDTIFNSASKVTGQMDNHNWQELLNPNGK